MNKQSGLLFGWCNDNKALSRRFLARLEEQGCRKIADLSGGVIVEFHKDWYTLVDNGGELNIEKINFGNSIRSIPYYHTPPITIGTMVYRVLAAMRGEEVDYNLAVDLLDDTRIL